MFQLNNVSLRTIALVCGLQEVVGDIRTPRSNTSGIITGPEGSCSCTSVTIDGDEVQRATTTFSSEEYITHNRPHGRIVTSAIQLKRNPDYRELMHWLIEKGHLSYHNLDLELESYSNKEPTLEILQVNGKGKPTGKIMESYPLGEHGSTVAALEGFLQSLEFEKDNDKRREL